MTNPKISVVVCTYNRAGHLARCLESLAGQNIIASDYEVIVVDNGSTDETETVAKSFSKKIARLKVVSEESIGLSHARNKGWREASTEYVAYIDDDAVAEPDWLEQALRVISERSPDILGGPIYPFYLTDKPLWFRDEYEIRSRSETARELKEDEHPSGSNLIIKRAILEPLGGFNPSLGMQGNVLRYGEDTDLVIRARKNIPSCLVYYDPRIGVHHLVPEHKMRLPYFFRSKFRQGRLSLDLHGLPERSFPHILATTAVALAQIGFQSSVGVALRDKSKQLYWQNHVAEDVAPLFGKLGLYYARFKSLLVTDRRSQ
jgi:glycosyltransferase involved in cell wall biosynthesis